MRAKSELGGGETGLRPRFPLSLKLLSWLALNLVLILALGGAVFLGLGGMEGWLRGPVSVRLQEVADAMAGEMQMGEDIAEVVAEDAETHGLNLAIYRVEGAWVAGESGWELPSEILAWMRPEPRAGEGLTLRGEGGRPPTMGGMPPPRLVDRTAGGGLQPRRQERGGVSERILTRAGEPEAWWAGVRMPIVTRPGEPTSPGVMVVRAGSVWEFAVLMDLRPMLVVVGVVVVLSILFWLPMVLRMTHALREMAVATREIAEGRFDTRVAMERTDEIGVLGRSINRMAARLDVLVNGQRKFLADIAHELGSPVGRLQVASSILAERVKPELKSRVADVQEEVDQMSELLGELLAFTKVGLQAREAKLQPVVLADVVEQARMREATGIAVHEVWPGDLVVLGDARLLVKVVGNLLRNAVSYGGPNVHITVEGRQGPEGMVELEILDDGPGVPEAALERLGEPFYRPDAARTRATGGTGLGLSIVRESVTALRGRVTFANRRPHGFAVVLTLRGADHQTLTSA